jgi:hypothetical protein
MLHRLLMSWMLKNPTVHTERRVACRAQAPWDLQEAAATFGTSSDVLALGYGLSMTYDGDKILFDQLNFTIKCGPPVRAHCTLVCRMLHSSQPTRHTSLHVTPLGH